MAARAGAIVIDNSSAWRMDPDVPLVVPEVNADALRQIPKGIVANPNCSTIQMVVALKPLHDLARIKRVVVVHLPGFVRQGREGPDRAGRPAGSRSAASEPMPTAKAHAAQLAGNVLPHDWKAGEDGYSRGRMEDDPRDAQDHGRRQHPHLADDGARPGAHRPFRGDQPGVPLRHHGRTGPRSAAERAWRDPRGRYQGQAPLPLSAEGRDEVFVGRIRRDPTVPYGLNLWVVADNLRKGAATNAVQIAEVLVQRGWLPRQP